MSSTRGAPDDLRQAQQHIKARLEHTWSAFFARFGNFRPAQLAAIPLLLDGANVVICAATASGKTEAAVTPLVERFCSPLIADVSPHQLQIVYLTPTRALVNDLYHRLQTPFEALRLRLAVKTRDMDTFTSQHPAALLITTPESFDSLMCRQPRAMIGVQAVVIDELHLFDGTARGDHVWMLLRRLTDIRAHAVAVGNASHSQIQYAALSATLFDPDAAARYFPDPVIVEVPQQRELQVERHLLTEADAADLHAFFATFRARGWRKVLAFCNSRAEVEHYAALTRAIGPFGNAVFTHYSNLAATRRRWIEARFSVADTAICFATSTLELGIDIGDIHAVLLFGTPGSIASFMQRIGRAGRRTDTASAAFLLRTPLEHLLADVVCSPDAGSPPPPPPFQAGVAVQQIFSMLKQMRTESLRLPQLHRLFQGVLMTREVDDLVVHLAAARYLIRGRPGDWHAGPALNRLVDSQFDDNAAFNLHSNIRRAGSPIEVRDQHTDQVLAHVDSRWLAQGITMLEGRPVQVEWIDGDAVWITGARSHDAPQSMFAAARQILSADLARGVARQLGFAPHGAPLLQMGQGWRLYHWLGDLYGEAFRALLRPYVLPLNAELPGLYITLAEPLRTLPPVRVPDIKQYVRQRSRALESVLQLSSFHVLLPPDLRRQTVMRQFGVERLAARVSALQIMPLATDDPRYAMLAGW